MKKIPYYLVALTMLLLTYCSSENGDWKNAKAQNDVQPYEQFIKDHPQSVFIDSANFMIKEILHPTGVVISVPSIIFSAGELMSGQIKEMNFDGNTIKVKLTIGKVIDATATQEQLEKIAQGEKNVKLEKTDKNEWKVIDNNNTSTETIK